MADQGDDDALAELEAAPKLPARAAYLWAHFLDVSQTRQAGQFGPQRLSRAEVRLWEADENVVLEGWERRLIFRLDGLWLSRDRINQEDEGEVA